MPTSRLFLSLSESTIKRPSCPTYFWEGGKKMDRWSQGEPGSERQREKYGKGKGQVMIQKYTISSVKYSRCTVVPCRCIVTSGMRSLVFINNVTANGLNKLNSKVHRETLHSESAKCCKLGQSFMGQIDTDPNCTAKPTLKKKRAFLIDKSVLLLLPNSMAFHFLLSILTSVRLGDV